MPKKGIDLSRESLERRTFHRTFQLERDAASEDRRLVPVSFSSELEVERWFGFERLDHAPGAVDMTRLKSGAPLLLEHERGSQIGVIESATILAGKGRAVLRFGKSAKAEEVYQDVLDEVRTNVSVGYRVDKLELASVDDEGREHYTATKWTPFEISIVSVPADETVGIGRSQQQNSMKKSTIQFDHDHTGGGGPSTEILRLEVREAERAEAREILAMAERWEDRTPGAKQMAQRFIDTGEGIKGFRKWLWENQPGVSPVADPNPMLGVSQRDLGRYSIARAIVKAADVREGKRGAHLDGLEGELSTEYERRIQKAPQGFWVPQDVLAHRSMTMKRDLLKGTGSLGGNLVATDLLAASFIDLLRNRAMVVKAGATVLNGLVGDVAIPRQSGGVTTYWVTETASSTESDATFEQVTLQPKCVTAVQDFARKLLIQGSLDVENLVRMDLAKQLAVSIDLAALHGSGSPQPTGVASVSGIGSVAGGTNGAAPTWANIVALETELGQDNSDENSLAYISNAKVRGKLKNTFISTASVTPVWEVTDNFEGRLNGQRAFCSNQVSSTLTKGTSTTVCSAIFFGDWSALLIGQWGGLDIIVDPYTQAMTRVIRVLAHQYTDINVRHPESFAAMLDALTT